MTDAKLKELSGLVDQLMELQKEVAGCFGEQSEAEHSGFYSRPLVIEFDDGSWIFPMADDEGNNGGALATSSETLDTIPVL